MRTAAGWRRCLTNCLVVFQECFLQGSRCWFMLVYVGLINQVQGSELEFIHSLSIVYPEMFDFRNSCVSDMVPQCTPGEVFQALSSWWVALCRSTSILLLGSGALVRCAAEAVLPLASGRGIQWIQLQRYTAILDLCWCLDDWCSDVQKKSFVWLSHPLISIECMNLFRGSRLYGIETTNHGIWGLYRWIFRSSHSAAQQLSQHGQICQSVTLLLWLSGWEAMGYGLVFFLPLMKRIPACMLLINWLKSLSIGGCYHVWWFRFQTIIGVMIPDWFTFFELQPPTSFRYIDIHRPLMSLTRFKKLPLAANPLFFG